MKKLKKKRKTKKKKKTATHIHTQIHTYSLYTKEISFFCWNINDSSTELMTSKSSLKI